MVVGFIHFLGRYYMSVPFLGSLPQILVFKAFLLQYVVYHYFP